MCSAHSMVVHGRYSSSSRRARCLSTHIMSGWKDNCANVYQQLCSHYCIICHKKAVSGVLLKTSASSGFGPDVDLIHSISFFLVGVAVHVLAPDIPSPSIIRKLIAIGASVVIHQQNT